MSDAKLRDAQYASSGRFDARVRIHAKYGTNKTPWPIWLFSQYRFPSAARIIEFGCGNGLLWKVNAFRIDPDWRITLTDFSDGMLDSAKAATAGIQGSFDYRVVDVSSFDTCAAYYDVAVANHMLYHIADRADAIMRMRNCLRASGASRDTGILYASTVGEGNMEELKELVREFTGNDSYAQVISSITDSFSLENGAAQLGSAFGDVDRIDYEDSLDITDADDLVDYVLSCNDLKPGVTVLAAEQREDFKSYVDFKMRTSGRIHVTKSSGTFVARV
jgi:SAM-dependent methyltransferase